VVATFSGKSGNWTKSWNLKIVGPKVGEEATDDGKSRGICLIGENKFIFCDYFTCFWGTGRSEFQLQSSVMKEVVVIS